MTLAQELAKPAYAGLTDQEAADAINAATVAVQRPIPAIDIKRYLMVTGKWPRIAGMARGLVGGFDSHILAAVALVEAFEAIPSFDLTVPAYALACNTQLAACVGAGLITDEERAAILAMADTTVPLRQTLGFARPLDHGDIKTARAP